MTPREKAKEIASKCTDSNRDAILVANEAIDILEKLYSSIIDEKALFKIKWEIIWWKEVRKEIEKIIKEI